MEVLKKIIINSQKSGFDLIGIVPVKASNDSQYLNHWLKQGFAGEMSWIKKGKEKRLNPLEIFPKAKSIIIVGINYYLKDLPEEIKNDPSRGIIARYAWFPDYHQILYKKLEQFVEQISKVLKTKVNSKFYVDTGPILERELAFRAGLGFIGNNTNLINPQLGSYLFIGEIFLDIELGFYVPKITGSCGTCQKCINSCPTSALVDKKLLDARKCISYLTIELRGEIPEELRPLIKNRIFGCDICQEVCPWNNRVKATSFFRPEGKNVPSRLGEEEMAPFLLELAFLSEEEFNERFKNSSVKRAKRSGFLRNVAVALGNWGDRKALPVLKRLSKDPNPLIKSHAVWAKRQILL